MNASESRATFVDFPGMVLPVSAREQMDQLAEALAEKIVKHLEQNQKELYTADDLVKRYGLKPSTIRAKILNGEFGDTVNLGAKSRLVTRAGLLAYEAAHTGPAEPKHSGRPPQAVHKRRENPGKI